MVEMAFVIFLLVLLLFGITEFGRALYTKNTLNNAARSGARVGVVTPGIADTGPITTSGPVQLNRDCTSYGTSTTPCTGDGCVYQAVCGSIVAAVENPVYVSVQIFDSTGTSPGQAPVAGKQVMVQVQAPFNPVLNLMKSMMSGTLSGQSTMRYE